MMKEELQKKISRLPGNAMRLSLNCRKLVMTQAIKSNSAKAKQFFSDSPAKP